MRRRLQLILFAIIIAKADRDRKLFSKLKPEWPGILQWAIEGCVDWQEHGLAPPKAVLDATEDYFVEQDSLGAWFAEACERDPNAWTATSALFAAWKEWAEKSNLYAGNVNDFTAFLDAQGDLTFARAKKANGYRGVRLA
jgi:phage/plasmid-associated DNA primase